MRPSLDTVGSSAPRSPSKACASPKHPGDAAVRAAERLRPRCAVHFHQAHQPLASLLVPVVAHPRGCALAPLRFLFYQPSCPNSYCPFYTAQKPTCGYRYRRDTDHTRKVMDVPSADLVKWRPVPGTKPPLMAINPEQ
uniref:Uncharacterized protein n=1 Tax=Apteryx owenii TaxID=8824 RepID=A0A8B9PK36_APTOW